jgi:hypothetical protein
MIVRKRPTVLRKLIIDEISLVDKPANEHCMAVLAKRDDAGPDDADPAYLQALLDSIRSAYEAEATKQEKNAFLRETLEQYAEFTGRDGLADISALTKKSPRFASPPKDFPGVRGFASTSDDDDEDEDEQARKDKEKRRRAAAAKENKIMNKAELVNVAKRLVAGSDQATTRGDLVGAARKMAIADRQPGETIEKALARFWVSQEGREVYQALQMAKVEDVVAPSTEIELGPAMKALHKRADEIRRGTAKTREQTVAKIATDPSEAQIWNAARAEERVRD